LDKCHHISVVVKYISKISTVTNSRDVKLKVRGPFSKIIHKRALSEMFENKEHILCDNFLTGRDKK
jgi:hypothetical protein